MKRIWVCPSLGNFLTILISLISVGPFFLLIAGESKFIVSIMVLFAAVIDIFIIIFFLILMYKQFGYILIKENEIKLICLFKERNCINLNEDVYYLISEAMVFRFIFRKYIFVSNKPISYKQFGNGVPTMGLSKICLNYDWRSVIAIPYNEKTAHFLDVSKWKQVEVVNDSLL